MKTISAIIQKELNTYFKSPIAYIILFIMVCVFNTFFYMIIDQNREATLTDMFQLMEFMFVFFLPILTMKVIAEEKANGTMEFLLTMPITTRSTVLGKYFASLIFFSCIIVMTVVYYLVLKIFSAPDDSAILVGYLGIWLEGALFIAIGVMTSTWTRNQIVAAIASYMIVFSLYFSGSLSQYTSGATKIFTNYLSTMTHSQNMFVGLLYLNDVVYYLSGIVFCLMIARISIENRLWR